MIAPNTTDPETIIEVVTREVLVALQESRSRASNPPGSFCKVECAQGLCVKTCFDKVGEVVSAGAERLDQHAW